ncbi:hypothetical protein BH23ACT11_BH23ACT11_20770 [soil metagenome]
MNNQQARQINAAARTFAEAIRESFRTTSQGSEEAQERANRLTQSFFASVMSELQDEAARNRTVSQQLMEQSKKQQAAFREMSEESMSLYKNFLGSVSAYYQSNEAQAERNVQANTEAATQSMEIAATSIKSTAEGHPGVPIEGYDDLNVEQTNIKLEGLSESELQRVREYEAQNKNRRTVLDRIDQKLV